ncbi:MAG: VanW family protein [Acutalibacteraceae bacterium]
MNNNENDIVNKYQDDTEQNSAEQEVNDDSIGKASDDESTADDSDIQTSDDEITAEDVDEQVFDEEVTAEDVDEQVSDEESNADDSEEHVPDEEVIVEDSEEQTFDDESTAEDSDIHEPDEEITAEDNEGEIITDSTDVADIEPSVEQIIAEMSAFKEEMTEDAVVESVAEDTTEPMVKQEVEVMAIENMSNEPQQPVFEEIFSDSGKNKAAQYNEDFREKVAQCMVDMGSERAESKKRVNLFKVSIVALLAVVLLVAGVLVYSAFTSKPGLSNGPANPGANVNTDYTDEDDEERFAPDIRIAGVNMEGKTFDVARKVLAKREGELVKRFTINIPYNDDVYSITQDDFTYLFDTDEVLKKAIDYSKMVKKDGELYEDDEYPVIQDTSSGEKYVDFELSYVLDESSVDDVVNDIAEKIEIEMVEPHVGKFTPLGGDKRFTIVSGKNGLTLDRDDLKNKIITSLKTDNDTIDIDVKTSVVKPTKKKSQIKDDIVLISSHTTISYNNWYGNENMRLALSKINGSIINTGEVLSFNKCTGNSNLPEDGWQPATVISGGKLETGYGGGICQAASTLYNAALKANMAVEERHNHLWPSSYVPTGLDATIDYPYLDLKLRNDSEYTMYFECYMDGTTLHVNIYGHKDTSFDKIELEASVDGYIDQPATVYTIDYSKADNYYSTTRYGNAGTLASARRIFYKNGKEIKRENLPDSEYGALATLVTVGPGYNSNGVWIGGSSSGGSGDTSSSSKPASSTPASSSSKPTSSSSRPASSSSKPASSSSKPASSSSKPVDPPSSDPEPIDPEPIDPGDDSSSDTETEIDEG